MKIPFIFLIFSVTTFSKVACSGRREGNALPRVSVLVNYDYNDNGRRQSKDVFKHNWPPKGDDNDPNTSGRRH